MTERMASLHEMSQVIDARDKTITDLRAQVEKLNQKIKLLKMTAMQALEPIDVMVMSEAEEKLYDMIRSQN